MILNIAIYNGFPFHYEMFGLILYWCKQNKFQCSIYTNTIDNKGWLDYYQEAYPFIIYGDCSQFIKDAHLYHIIFLPTDDDYSFDASWLNIYGVGEKIVRLNHVPYDRYPQIKRSIDIRNYVSDNTYAYNFFDIINAEQKSKIVIRDTINIFLSARTYHYDTKNLKILDNHPNVILHFIARKIDPKFRQYFKSTNQFHENIETKEMLNIIAKCQYMFFGLEDNISFRHNAMSAFLMLSYSCCTPVIMDAETFSSYNLNTAISYTDDITQIFPKFRERIDYEKIEDERNISYTALDNYVKEWRPKLFERVKCNILIPKTIHFMWLAKDGSVSGVPDKYRRNIETFRIHNPDYEIKIWDVEEVNDIIKKNLPEFYETFLEITPWISKCDFARFCVIYIYGGIYSDLDFYCSKNIDSLLHDKDHIFSFEPKEHGKHHLYNGFFAAIPKSKFVYGWLIEMQGHLLITDVMAKSGPIGLAMYYYTAPNKPQLTETHKIMLYNDKHKVMNDIGGINNIDDNYVYTIWNEGTSWGSTTAFTMQCIVVGIVIIILVLIFGLYLLARRP